VRSRDVGSLFGIENPSGLQGANARASHGREPDASGGIVVIGKRCQSRRKRRSQTVDMKLEVVLLPVSDVDRAKAFYKTLQWRLDADFAPRADFRIVQLTPPGSECSIIMGAGITSAAPGSMQGLQLTVADIEEACAELRGHGVDVDGPFHDVDNLFHRIGTDGRVQGADPDHRSYVSFASFSDPDGNGWLLQEVKQRAPGR
jgi:catechol 2,3-dioxygenase-like lactoylglutathione lyase family enzyme